MTNTEYQYVIIHLNKMEKKRNEKYKHDKILSSDRKKNNFFNRMFKINESLSLFKTRKVDDVIVN